MKDRMIIHITIEGDCKTLSKIRGKMLKIASSFLVKCATETKCTINTPTLTPATFYEEESTK